ncbi:hypothetical protein H4R34_002050 [Dimargaris verticillata]|uniref:Uncharacterized protein n=1 Tax=Dimargaris verticillata TaxID=2761393 RepID=A0A9W8B8T2_9FUNG|nr:hypothetical protein H4R34_002050 [Dimargaris verticillata]
MLPNIVITGASSVSCWVLGQCLQLTIAHRDYARAAKILTALYSSGTVPLGLLWKSGAYVFRQTTSGFRTIRFLQSHLEQQTINGIELVQELVATHVAAGTLEQAHALLESYLDKKPFRDNAILFGYLGIITMLLRNDEIRKLNDDPIDQDMRTALGLSDSDSNDNEGSNRSVSDDAENADSSSANDGSSDNNDDEDDSRVPGRAPASQLVNKNVYSHDDALLYFDKAYELDPNMDYFFPYYLPLLTRLGYEDRAKAIAIKFCLENPELPSGYRLVLLMLDRREKQDYTVWVELAPYYLKMVPVADWDTIASPLCAHYEYGILQGEDHLLVDLIDLLAQRIEFTRGQDLVALKKLVDVYYSTQELYGDTLATTVRHKVWKPRVTWWPKFLFDLPEFLDLEAEDVTGKSMGTVMT